MKADDIEKIIESVDWDIIRSFLKTKHKLSEVGLTKLLDLEKTILKRRINFIASGTIEKLNCGNWTIRCSGKLNENKRIVERIHVQFTPIRVSYNLKDESLPTKRNGNNVLIAKAKTGMVCYNYEEKKVRELPEKFISKLKKY